MGFKSFPASRPPLRSTFPICHTPTAFWLPWYGRLDRLSPIERREALHAFRLSHHRIPFGSDQEYRLAHRRQARSVEEKPEGRSQEHRATPARIRCGAPIPPRQAERAQSAGTVQRVGGTVPRPDSSLRLSPGCRSVTTMKPAPTRAFAVSQCPTSFPPVP